MQGEKSNMLWKRNKIKLVDGEMREEIQTMQMVEEWREIKYEITTGLPPSESVMF